jgi:PIN domain nuclease of toxin-antitoxin system
LDTLLDASAVLALLQGERGSERVKRALPESAITSVNACEILGVLVRGGLSPAAAVAAFEMLAIPVLAFTYTQARAGASLARLKVSRPLSLGDRACLGAAIEGRKSVLTAERYWSQLDLEDVRIEIIR